MLLEAAQYKSPSLKVLLVTEKVDALQKAVQRMLLPLNISYYQADKPPGDNNQYWLTWEHRTAIRLAVAKANYSTVVYMEVRGCCTHSESCLSAYNQDENASLVACFVSV